MFLDPILPDGTVIPRQVPRSLVALAALVTGFLVAGQAGGLPSSLWLSAACAACLVAAITRGVPCRVALTLAAVCFGAGWFTLRMVEPERGSLSLRLGQDEASVVTVEGVVLATPRVSEPDPDPMSLPVLNGTQVRLALATDAVVTEQGREAVSGRVWVRASGTRPASSDEPRSTPRAGDRISITGLFSPISGPMNPGEWDRRLWSRQSGFVGSLRVGRLDDAKLIGSGGTLAELESTWLRARAWLSDRARELLLGDPAGGASPATREGRALLGALILGEEDPALRDSRAAFNRLGLAHVLSISGFHIAVMTAVGLLLLRAAGDLGWLEPVLIAALVLVYLAILPFNAPVWRSGLMVLGLLAGDALGRRYDRMAMLGWIAVMLLLWRPMDAWSMGFQLSFGLVGVLLWFGAPFHVRLWGMRLKGRVPTTPTVRSESLEWVKKLISTNVLCCAAAMPIVMYHTGLVSPLSVATGVVVIPLITIVLIAGYAVVGLGVLIPALTGSASIAVAALAGWTSWLVRWIDEIPWSSMRCPNVSLAWAIGTTAVLLYWLSRGYLRDRIAWSSTVLVVSWFGLEAWLGPRLPTGIDLRIDTLAVGDGTCHLVRSGREAMLWDCGSLTPGVGRMLVPRAVRELGAWRVPTVVITHPNIDHFNAILDIAEPLGVKRVLVGEAFIAASKRPHGPEAFLVSGLRARGVEIVTVTAGMKVQLGSAVLQFLSPPAGADWGGGNDMSLVASVSTPGRPGVGLLCGDIQDRAIAHVSGVAVRPVIMEAPHHGSARESAIEFVSQADPPIVVQSTGASRAGDERWATVRAGRVWRCTATDGACWVEVMRDGTARSGTWR